MKCRCGIRCHLQEAIKCSGQAGSQASRLSGWGSVLKLPVQTGAALKRQVRLQSPEGEDARKKHDVSRMLNLKIGNLQVDRREAAKELEGRAAQGCLTRREKGEKPKEKAGREMKDL